MPVSATSTLSCLVLSQLRHAENELLLYFIQNLNVDEHADFDREWKRWGKCVIIISVGM